MNNAFSIELDRTGRHGIFERVVQMHSFYLIQTCGTTKFLSKKKYDETYDKSRLRPLQLDHPGFSPLIIYNL